MYKFLFKNSQNKNVWLILTKEPKLNERIGKFSENISNCNIDKSSKHVILRNKEKHTFCVLRMRTQNNAK